MIVALVVSLLGPILIGALLVRLLWPGQPRTHGLLKGCLAIGIGYGVTSCVFFLMLLRGLSAGISFIAELAIIVALSVALRVSARRQTDVPAGQLRPISGAERLLQVAFLCALALAFAAFVMLSLREPHGGDADNWDSWGLWNLRARLIHRLGAEWPATVAHRGLLYSPNPDYPLLLPLSVARSWNYIGSETTLVPAALAFLFTFAVVGVIFGSLCVLRSRAQGYAGALVLLGFPAFVIIGAWQYADMPLALFIVMTLVLFCCYDRAADQPRGLLILAGLSTGLAVWVKNEGWLFLAGTVIARALAVGLSAGRKPYLKQMLYYSLGLLPLLSIVVLFKLDFAATNSFVSGQTLRSTLTRMSDLSRYSTIIRMSFDEVLRSTGWIASVWALLPYALILGVVIERKDRSSMITIAVTLAVILIGYFFVYVVTPYDLPWHLRTSVMRLLLHLWPGFVLMYFLVIAPVTRQPARVREGESPACEAGPVCVSRA